MPPATPLGKKPSPVEAPNQNRTNPWKKTRWTRKKRRTNKISSHRERDSPIKLPPIKNLKLRKKREEISSNETDKVPPPPSPFILYLIPPSSSSCPQMPSAQKSLAGSTPSAERVSQDRKRALNERFSRQPRGNFQAVGFSGQRWHSRGRSWPHQRPRSACQHQPQRRHEQERCPGRFLDLRWHL